MLVMVDEIKIIVISSIKLPSHCDYGLNYTANPWGTFLANFQHCKLVAKDAIDMNVLTY